MSTATPVVNVISGFTSLSWILMCILRHDEPEAFGEWFRRILQWPQQLLVSAYTFRHERRPSVRQHMMAVLVLCAVLTCASTSAAFFAEGVVIAESIAVGLGSMSRAVRIQELVSFLCSKRRMKFVLSSALLWLIASLSSTTWALMTGAPAYYIFTKLFELGTISLQLLAIVVSLRRNAQPELPRDHEDSAQPPPAVAHWSDRILDRLGGASARVQRRFGAAETFQYRPLPTLAADAADEDKRTTGTGKGGGKGSGSKMRPKVESKALLSKKLDANEAPDAATTTAAHATECREQLPSRDAGVKKPIGRKSLEDRDACTASRRSTMPTAAAAPPRSTLKGRNIR